MITIIFYLFIFIVLIAQLVYVLMSIRDHKRIMKDFDKEEKGSLVVISSHNGEKKTIKLKPGEAIDINISSEAMEKLAPRIEELQKYLGVEWVEEKRILNGEVKMDFAGYKKIKKQSNDQGDVRLNAKK